MLIPIFPLILSRAGWLRHRQDRGARVKGSHPAKGKADWTTRNWSWCFAQQHGHKVFVSRLHLVSPCFFNHFSKQIPQLTRSAWVSACGSRTALAKRMKKMQDLADKFNAPKAEDLTEIQSRFLGSNKLYTRSWSGWSQKVMVKTWIVWGWRSRSRSPSMTWRGFTRRCLMTTPMGWLRATARSYLF